MSPAAGLWFLVVLVAAGGAVVWARTAFPEPFDFTPDED